jgi:hypothetical protein
MKGTMKAVVLSFALLLLVIGLSAAPPGDSGGPGPAGFAKKVAGTYVDWGVIGTGEFTGYQTLHTDGTHVSTNTNCCGSAGGPQSHGQGVWTKTGNRQITLTAVIFVFLEDGTPFITARPTLIMDFDEEFETAAGTITTDLFAYGQDPTDPNEIPAFGTLTGEDTWKKLHVVDLSPAAAVAPRIHDSSY